MAEGIAERDTALLLDMLLAAQDARTFVEGMDGAAGLARADRSDDLAAFLDLDLTPNERTVARVEGWILGVPGSARPSS